MTFPLANRTGRFAGWTRFSLILCVICGFWGPGCRRHSSESSLSPLIAVTNSYLAAAVTDLTEGRLECVLLAEPGTCPGHFDLTPGQLRRLRTVRLLLQFDFQQGLDRQLPPSAGARIRAIQAPPAMASPASYLQVCRQVAQALTDGQLLGPDQAARQLDRIDQRCRQLETWALEQIHQAALDRQPALVAVHQAEFIRWLGLDVVAMFSSADTLRIEQLHQTLTAAHRSKPRLVIANRSEGLEPARSLAEYLHVPLVVLDNFPVSDGPDAFEKLFRGNMEAILAAVR